MSTNQDVANMLIKIANIKKANNDNRFSIGAYLKAATLVSNLSVPVTDLDLENTKGIGPKISSHIVEFLNSGKVKFIEDNQYLLESEPSQNIQDLLRIEGIGEKTAILIYQELKISTVEELKKVIDDGSISKIFKEKTIEKIKKGIEYLETTKGRIRLDQGIELASRIYTYLKPFVDRIEFCGSLRRTKETVGDVDFAVIAKVGVDVLQKFREMPIIDKVIDAGGEKKSSVWVEGVRIDCYVFTDDLFESGIMHLTGSDEHNKRLREMVISKGWILSQYGLYNRGEDNKRIGQRLDDGTEKGIYNLLGLQWIPPEHREGNIEIKKYAIGNEVPLLEEEDIKFDFHVHSTWSDGVSSIRENVLQAIKEGLSGIAICDHSQSLKIAKGLSIDRLKEKIKEVELLRKEFPKFKIFMGSEVDIKSDGTLDYPDEILDKLDVVVASIHTSTKKDVTDIYKIAIETGKVDIIGHITGRMINDRPGLDLNIEQVLKACATNNVAIELNCQPNRLDANDVILKRCKQLGIKIALGSDAHEKNQISYVKTFGLWIGRRAWLTKDDLFYV